ncbi:MAG: maleylpyruvate isomerase N-terminal domain-containing protein [Acidimicrobiales bacterium]
MSLPGNVGTVLTSEVALLSRQVVQDLTDEDMVAGTGCRGWRVADLIVHLGADTEALLVALACPIEEPADRDYLSWWRDWPHEGAVSFDSVRASWARTSSYPSGGSIRGRFCDLARASISLLLKGPSGRLSFQGHVSEVADFAAMWTVELALHHLDLGVELADRPGPEEQALDLAVLTLDGLLGEPRPSWWDQLTYLRKGTGRATLTEEERRELGLSATRYPAFG